MTLLDFFLFKKKKTAIIAKKRLKIIIAEQKKNTKQPNYIPALKKEILKTICKYIKIDKKSITVEYDKKNNNISVLELNVKLPK
ncbi:MAG: cell division topological specificity factor MinE [Buchnera aphidicola (Periphyllus lyropictus)]|uniref:cell division topological specificity factor MinE n=1 Tax=Buchnera aphidicola TaxID=9 RepID=UPI001ED2EC58|nr:cell division topological specificity factor MinE [Buchnera aphidicola]NIH16811.1 cell division topological specificity factor MinE [Buchnera aphidicola (Periphyllus lyropictus)]USS94494.1 cell division topological specificity factor MinE [Buchnera aphidicola (Periphyllus lyropictus)]